jgi:GNAT superfamily N-acetyltransferase
VAKAVDADRLTRIFWEHLTARPEYASHGEMQMGVADAEGRPAAGGEGKWRGYIQERIDDADRARVFVSEREGEVDGFAVVEVDEDGDQPFGVVCDLLVAPGRRGEGVGGALLEAGVAWLRGRGVSGVYLESGIDNRDAHAFFERRGFREISRVFALSDGASLFPEGLAEQHQHGEDLQPANEHE